MKPQRALRSILVLAGLACIAGLFPLVGAFRAGTGSAINRQDQMILGVYVVLGAFLLSAARRPSDHRSLILFAAWSTLAHDAVMITQGIQFHDLRNDVWAYSIIASIGLILLALAPPSRARVEPYLAEPTSEASRLNSRVDG